MVNTILISVQSPILVITINIPILICFSRKIGSNFFCEQTIAIFNLSALEHIWLTGVGFATSHKRDKLVPKLDQCPLIITRNYCYVWWDAICQSEPVYMEKSSPLEEGYPLPQAIVSSVYMKRVVLADWAKNWSSPFVHVLYVLTCPWWASQTY